jgi:hypothetical protein
MGYDSKKHADVIMTTEGPDDSKPSRASKPQVEPATSPYSAWAQPLNFGMDEPQHRGKEHRDDFVRHIEWKREMQNLGLWNEEKEAKYQTERLQEIEYWKLFLTPTAESSAKRLTAWFADVWSLRVGRQWNPELVRIAKQELGLEL